MFVLSALVFLAQGSYLDIIEQESLDGPLHSGGVLSAASLAGVSQGRSAVAQPQRSESSHGSAGRLPVSSISGSRTHGATGGYFNRPAAGSPNRSVGSSLNGPTGAAYNRPTGGHSVRPIGAGHGNVYANRNRSQKPH